MKAIELKMKTLEELSTELQELQKEQFNLRMQKGVSESAPKIQSFKEVRRNIARVKTVIVQKMRENHG